MMDKKTFRNIVHLLLLAAVLALIVVYFSTIQAGLKKLWGPLMPLLLGIVFAYLVDIPAKWIEKRIFGKFKKPLAARVFAVFISLIFFLVLITGVLILLLPQLGLAISQFSTNLPVLYQEAVSSLEQFMRTRPELEQGFSTIEGYMNTFVDNLKASSPKIADYALSVLGGAINGVVNGAIALVFSLYLLFGKRRVLSQLAYLMERFIPEKYSKKIVHVKVVANRTFGKFFTGQFVEAIILGSLCTLGMLLFRFPYALTVGSVVGMTAIIPLVGAYLGGAVGFVLLFSQGYQTALLFVLFLVILQQLEGNIIYPRVVGTSVGLPGVWVFTAVILGGGLFGIPGILFGVPFVATIYQLLKTEKDQEVLVM
jgi:predicted PurR-regulated permease PerM